MRSKKLKLAAVVLSAIMAAGTMPATAFAEDFDVAEVYVETEALEEAVAPRAEAEVEDQYKTLQADPEFSRGADTGKVYAEYTLVSDNGETKEFKEEATITKTTPATYQSGTIIDATIKILGKEYSTKIVLDDKVKSDNVFKDVIVITKAAKCEEDGEGYKVTYTLVPGATLNADNTANEKDIIEESEHTPITIAAFGHDFEEKVTLKAGENTKIVNGKAELVDPKQNGTYFEVTTKVCKVDGVKEVEEKEKELKSEIVDSESAEITDSKNIAGVIGKDGSLTPIEEVAVKDIPSDINKIQLIDCKKAGTYTISYYTTAGDLAYTKDVTVAAHHTTVTTIEFKDEKDRALCEVDEEKLTVKNLVCTKDITYYLVTNCVAEKHGKDTLVSKQTHVAKASDVHNYNRNLKADLSKADVALTNDEVEEYKADAEALSIKVGKSTATCKADGTVTITFLCNQCGKEVDSVTVKVKKHEAVPGTPKLVTIKEPTCTEEGIAKRTVACTICGTEIESTELPIQKIAHTNENGTDKEAVLDLVGDIVVGWDYEKGDTWESEGGILQIGETGYCVTARVYTACEKCGEYKEYFGPVKVEVTDVQSQSKDGQAGSITLKASYKVQDTKKEKTLTKTITVPYYSSWIAYLDRNNTTVNVKNGLTKDADDVWRLYKDGKFQDDYTGIYNYDGGEFYLKDGVLQSDVSGLTLVGDTFYFLANGQVQRTDAYTGYDGAFFHIVNGELDTELNGLVDYDGGKFLFTTGKLRSDVSGLWLNPADNVWYFLANGQVQTQYTGVALYDGEFFVVENGVFNNSYNGTIEHDGATFNVVNGQLYGQAA